MRFNMARRVSPQSLGEALEVALSHREAEKQGGFNKTLCARCVELAHSSSRSSSLAIPGLESQQRLADISTVGYVRVRRNATHGNAETSAKHSSRNAQNKSASRCIKCKGIGHFAMECPTRRKRAKYKV